MSTPLGQEINRSVLTLQGIVFDRLRSEIISGAIALGSRLNEVEIARRLGVSRGPVREAIARLRSEGLVVARPHHGTFVRNLEPDDISELFDVRIGLEMMATRLVAELASPEDLIRIRSFFDASMEVISTGNAAYPEEMDIHELIVVTAKNKHLTDSVKRVHTELRLARSKSGYSRERAVEAGAEHEFLIQAIERRDAAEASELLRIHLEASRRNALSLLD